MKSKILGLLAVGLLAGPMAANAVGVVVDDKEWRQVTETTNFSWNQIATVCNTTTGACSGSLGAVSLDGWTWAANTDIQALFDALIQPGTTNFPTSTTDYQEVASAGIAAALGSNGFSPTGSDFYFRTVRALTRTVARPDMAYSPLLWNYFDARSHDLAWLSSDVPRSISTTGWGAWLYRAVPVPEPGSLVLLGLGLLSLGMSRRRKAA